MTAKAISDDNHFKDNPSEKPEKSRNIENVLRVALVVFFAGPLIWFMTELKVNRSEQKQSEARAVRKEARAAKAAPIVGRWNCILFNVSGAPMGSETQVFRSDGYLNARGKKEKYEMLNSSEFTTHNGRTKLYYEIAKLDKHRLNYVWSISGMDVWTRCERN